MFKKDCFKARHWVLFDLPGLEYPQPPNVDVPWVLFVIHCVSLSQEFDCLVGVEGTGHHTPKDVETSGVVSGVLLGRVHHQPSVLQSHNQVWSLIAHIFLALDDFVFIEQCRLFCAFWGKLVLPKNGETRFFTMKLEFPAILSKFYITKYNLT